MSCVSSRPGPTPASPTSASRAIAITRCTSFETLYPYRESLTVIGRQAEEAGMVRGGVPGLPVCWRPTYARSRCPTATSTTGSPNAVVEHAGPRDQQVALVAEVCPGPLAVCSSRRPTSASRSTLRTFPAAPCTGCRTGPIARRCGRSATLLLRGHRQPQPAGRLVVPLAVPLFPPEPPGEIRASPAAVQPGLHLLRRRTLAPGPLGHGTTRLSTRRAPSIPIS